MVIDGKKPPLSPLRGRNAIRRLTARQDLNSLPVAAQGGLKKTRVRQGPPQGKGLTFRELEALARTLLTVLLALVNARIAGQETFLLKKLSQLNIVFQQSPSHAQAHGACLTHRSAAAY